MTRVRVFSVAFNPSPVPPGASEQLFSVPGVQLGDFIVASKPTPQVDLIIGGARAAAKGQVGVTFGNFSTVPLTLTAGEFYSILAVSSGHCDDDDDDHIHGCCDDDEEDDDDE